MLDVLITLCLQGDQYWRLDGNMVMEPGYPKPLVSEFPGLTGHISAALAVPATRSKPETVYFFKNGEEQRQTQNNSIVMVPMLVPNLTVFTHCKCHPPHTTKLIVPRDEASDIIGYGRGYSNSVIILFYLFMADSTLHLDEI